MSSTCKTENQQPEGLWSTGFFAWGAAFQLTDISKRRCSKKSGFCHGQAYWGAKPREKTLQRFSVHSHVTLAGKQPHNLVRVPYPIDCPGRGAGGPTGLRPPWLRCQFDKFLFIRPYVSAGAGEGRNRIAPRYFAHHLPFLLCLGEAGEGEESLHPSTPEVGGKDAVQCRDPSSGACPSAPHTWGLALPLRGPPERR